MIRCVRLAKGVCRNLNGVQYWPEVGAPCGLCRSVSSHTVMSDGKHPELLAHFLSKLARSERWSRETTPVQLGKGIQKELCLRTDSLDSFVGPTWTVSAGHHARGTWIALSSHNHNCTKRVGNHVRHCRSITSRDRYIGTASQTTATNARTWPPPAEASPLWKATCMSHHRRTRWSKTLATAAETPTTNEVLTSDDDTTATLEDINVAKVQCHEGTKHVLEKQCRGDDAAAHGLAPIENN